MIIPWLKRPQTFFFNFFWSGQDLVLSASSLWEGCRGQPSNLFLSGSYHRFYLVSSFEPLSNCRSTLARTFYPSFEWELKPHATSEPFPLKSLVLEGDVKSVGVRLTLFEEPRVRGLDNFYYSVCIDSKSFTRDAFKHTFETEFMQEYCATLQSSIQHKPQTCKKNYMTVLFIALLRLSCSIWIPGRRKN